MALWGARGVEAAPQRALGAHAPAERRPAASLRSACGACLSHRAVGRNDGSPRRFRIQRWRAPTGAGNGVAAGGRRPPTAPADSAGRARVAPGVGRPRVWRGASERGGGSWWGGQTRPVGRRAPQGGVGAPPRSPSVHVCVGRVPRVWAGGGTHSIMLDAPNRQWPSQRGARHAQSRFSLHAEQRATKEPDSIVSDAIPGVYP